MRGIIGLFCSIEGVQPSSRRSELLRRTTMNVRRDAQNAGRRRTTMKNSVVHFEIYADDVDRLEQFYKGLFDWTIESPPGMDYHMIKTVDTGADNRPVAGGINGGMLKRPAGYGVSAW